MIQINRYNTYCTTNEIMTHTVYVHESSMDLNCYALWFMYEHMWYSLDCVVDMTYCISRNRYIYMHPTSLCWQSKWTHFLLSDITNLLPPMFSRTPATTRNPHEQYLCKFWIIWLTHELAPLWPLPHTGYDNFMTYFAWVARLQHLAPKFGLASFTLPHSCCIYSRFYQMFLLGLLC